MITLVTNYDIETQANYTALCPYLDEHALVGENAIRNQLLKALRQWPTSCLGVWSHGTHDGPREQGGGIALHLDDLKAVSPRPAYVFACHTGTRFGRAAAAEGWHWWGYTGAIGAPGDNAQEVAILGRALWTAFQLFRAVSSLDDIPETLTALKESVSRWEEELDQASDASGDSYLCLLHLWDRLRVWVPGADEPVAPEGCCSPILIP